MKCKYCGNKLTILDVITYGGDCASCHTKGNREQINKRRLSEAKAQAEFNILVKKEEIKLGRRLYK